MYFITLTIIKKWVVHLVLECKWLTVISTNLERFFAKYLECVLECVFSGLKGRVGAGDYRERARRGIRGVSVQTSFYVCFHSYWGSSPLSGLLKPAASVTPISNAAEGESEKSVQSFPLIMGDDGVSVSKQTALLLMTAAHTASHVTHSGM